MKRKITFRSKKEFYRFSEELCNKNISFTAVPTAKEISFDSLAPLLGPCPVCLDFLKPCSCKEAQNV